MIGGINYRLHNLNTFELNIDSRQLEVTCGNFQAKDVNWVGFMKVDACILHFENDPFGRILIGEFVFLVISSFFRRCSEF
jgi:hypothetical protein